MDPFVGRVPDLDKPWPTHGSSVGLARKFLGLIVLGFYVLAFSSHVAIVQVQWSWDTFWFLVFTSGICLFLGKPVLACV